MHIKSIRLEQFRNYEDQFLNVQPGINVLYGNNAQGKTNILEAIYLCACARSHRTSKDTDMIRHNAGQYQVTIDYENDNGSSDTLSILYLDSVSGSTQKSGPARHIFHNGLKVDRISDLMGLFHAVIFAPEDLLLVKEGPSTRRRFIDLMISQLRPSYFKDLQLYSRLLGQRNRLLKEIRLRDPNLAEDHPLMMQLDVWTQTLSETAARIIRQRLIFISRIETRAAEALDQISSGKEKLNVRYKTFASISSDYSVDDIIELLYKKHKSIVYEDINRGSTSYGPHRDDMELCLNNEQLKPYASQGQQRSVVLSLKMSELAIIKEEINEYPVLLLDDVMSELDEKRRGCLLAGIHQAQVFVTCTEAGHVVQEMEQACRYEGQKDKSEIAETVSFADNITTETDKKFLKQYSFYHVEAGAVERES
jgi:DNA replication and repair protein RecF